jgi:hypothetical protein
MEELAVCAAAFLSKVNIGHFFFRNAIRGLKLLQ